MPENDNGNNYDAGVYLIKGMALCSKLWITELDDKEGHTWVKIESTESREPAVLANQSSEPTKFLSCESRSAVLTKERLVMWCPC